MGKSFGKQNSSFSQTVYMGSFDMGITVTAQPVRTQRVDGDKQEILFAALGI
jgi:hypothetical protein